MSETPDGSDECGADQWRDGATCRDLTVCADDELEETPPTAVSDRVCVDERGCSTAPDRECSVECPCDSGQGVCTADDQCKSGATCVSGSGKKVGRSGDTCLAAHCNNDQLDSGETSVDCGGECGCRATFEIVTVSGLPANSTLTELSTMSRDGKRFGGYLGRGNNGFPAAIAADGKVTELESYGSGGRIDASSADGNVLVGLVGCANPPSCSDTTWSIAQWTGTTAPKVITSEGSPRRISSSGSIIVGDYYESSADQQQVFIISGNQRQSIAEMDWAGGVTPDGRYVAGRLRTGPQGGLWYAQTQKITKLGSTSWVRTNITGVNGTDPVVIGDGYTKDDTNIGFRWKGGVLTELGFLEGGKYTLPNAVSFDGSTIVGTTGTNAFQIAFIWTEEKKLVSLLDELASRGLELPVDLTLRYAHFISDDGKIIVGVEHTQPFSFWRVVLD